MTLLQISRFQNVSGPATWLQPLLRLGTYIGTEWRAYKALRAVESLSDAALHDIGIQRSEAEHAVRHGRPFRPWQ